MKRVLMIHTGGTLGMTGSPLEPGAFAERLTEIVPEITSIAELESVQVANLDSSDIGPEHWTHLTETIAERYDDFAGFVVIHGTDTMAYTAGALSFSLENLSKPVVLTGAQRPLLALRTDARRNLADAVELATREIPEVGICFDGLFLRGSRSTKTSASDYRGFESPDCAPLARLGVDITIAPHILPRPLEPFHADGRFNRNVLYMQVLPGQSPEVLDHVLSTPGLRGVVLSAFGLGTLPTRFNPLAPTIAKWVDRGLDVVVITTSSGQVDFGKYKNSKALESAGAISGGALRTEAAVTKLMHAIARFPDDTESRRAYLERNVAGERA